MNPFKAARLRKRMKQYEASIQLGVSPSTMSMWETGESQPHGERLKQVAQLYNCTTDELLGVETNKKPPFLSAASVSGNAIEVEA